MSALHPIIAVTGSSGAGTSTVGSSFNALFAQSKLRVVTIQGDAFHRYDREEMQSRIQEAERAGLRPPSHFGPEANHLDLLEKLFEEYAKSGTGRTRNYLHRRRDNEENASSKKPSFTPWTDLPTPSDLLFYEGLHGGVVTDQVDIARHVDLLIGVVPIINLEWIQKIHRDTQMRGYSVEAVQDTILRRMHDYVHYIVPQFSRTHINFQRVPIVDTSNPFIVREVPGPDESLVVIRFRDARSVDLSHLLNMISGAWLSRANTLVVPGAKMQLALELIVAPLIDKLINKRRSIRSYKPPKTD